ncbi:MAG: hypothetical protein WAU31_00080 [Candidatus Moraniibacteriota bacterium]
MSLNKNADVRNLNLPTDSLEVISQLIAAGVYVFPVFLVAYLTGLSRLVKTREELVDAFISLRLRSPAGQVDVRKCDK